MSTFGVDLRTPTARGTIAAAPRRLHPTAAHRRLSTRYGLAAFAVTART